MTEETYEYLKRFESFFITAQEGYAGAISDYGLRGLKEAYENEVKGKIYLNMNCSRCKLDLLQKLGIIYFEEKDNRAIKEDTNEESIIESRGVQHRYNRGENKKKEKGKTTRS